MPKTGKNNAKRILKPPNYNYVYFYLSFDTYSVCLSWIDWFQKYSEIMWKSTAFGCLPVALNLVMAYVHLMLCDVSRCLLNFCFSNFLRTNTIVYYMNDIIYYLIVSECKLYDVGSFCAKNDILEHITFVGRSQLICYNQ